MVCSAGGLTRFADSVIHQHTEHGDVGLQLRVIDAQRSGRVSTNRIHADAVAEAGTRALEIARLSPPDALFPGLPRDESGSSLLRGERFDDATAGATPASRAAAVAEAVRSAGDRPAAGFLATDQIELALANTNGVRRYSRMTVASYTCMVRSGDGTGYDSAASWRVSDVDLPQIAGTQSEWADRGREPSGIEPGTYPVVLMPLAVSELVEYLSYMGFGAKSVFDGESFFCDRTGATVAADLVTIADDVSNEHSLGTPFDAEGVWRRRVEMIANGVATQPVYDTRAGAEAGMPTTGHSVGNQEVGPLPLNLIVEPGAASEEELVAGIDRGLLVRRFWYVNIVNPRETTLTGMTRDGLFLIEDGKVSGPVNNLRFTQDVLAALAGCSGVGRKVQTSYSGWDFGISIVAPALRLDAFTFTSATTH